MGAVRNTESSQRDLSPREVIHFINKDLRIDDHACSEDGKGGSVEDAGREKVKLEYALVGLHGVAGVGASIGANIDFRCRGKMVGELSFTFVAPLSAHDDGDWHSDRRPFFD